MSGADHLDDLGDRRDVELGGDARREVLAGRGGRHQDRVVAAPSAASTVAAMASAICWPSASLSATSTLRTPSILAASAATAPTPLPMTSTSTSPDSAVAAVTVLWVVSFSDAIVVVGDDEHGHQITPASVFSLATSSAAVSTLTPATRLGGSVTFSTFRCPARSTPIVGDAA